MAERNLDPRGPNKFEPDTHEVFPGQEKKAAHKEYPHKGRNQSTPKPPRPTPR